MKTYGQFCAVARALDHVGDRWTLLVLRELLIGPRRFSDLRRNLPGVASNLLADRLRRLANDELIQRIELPKPAIGAAFALTERGREIEPVILELVRFGAQYMREGTKSDIFRPEWLALAIRALLPEKATVALTAQLRASDVALILRTGSDIRVEVGEVIDPDVTVDGDALAILSVFARERPLSDLRVGGDEAAFRRLLGMEDASSRGVPRGS